MKKTANTIYGFWIASILSGFVTVVAAQSQSSLVKQRYVLDEAISTIEDYESFATISDDETLYNFVNLFTNENNLVYNDLLGISSVESLTAKEYSSKLYDGLRNKKATIKNIKKEKMWFENDSWKVRFAFDKTLSYTNKCGIYFSSNEFYEKEYHLVATLIYDERLNKCKIETITGSVDSQKKLPDTFFAFRTEDKRDKDLTYRNRKMEFNSYGQALLEGTYDKSAFRYSDPDVELTPIIDECNNVSMRYKARKMRVKLHYDLGVGEAFNLSDADILNSQKTKSTSFGIDFGYIFPSKSNLKTGMFVGLGMTQSTIEAAFQSTDYQYTTDADVDGDSYIRHYNNLSISQKAKLTELTIPAYADFNIKLHNLVSLYFDLGVNLNLNIAHDVENEGSASIYGVYPQYGNLRLDEHWGFNGFGQKTFSNSDLDDPDWGGVSSFTADAFGGAGLRFNIPSTPLSIDLGAKYVFGLMDVATPGSNKAEVAENAQLVYNTISGRNSTEHVRNFSDTFSNIKRRSLRLSVGVIYKF